MNWWQKQQQAESEENQRNELITEVLKGKMSQTRKSIILWINSKRKVKL